MTSRGPQPRRPPSRSTTRRSRARWRCRIRVERLPRRGTGRLRSGARPCRVKEPEEPVPTVRAKAEIVEVGAVRETQWLPAAPEVYAESGCCLIACGVAVEDAEDPLRPGQEAEPIAGDV